MSNKVAKVDRSQLPLVNFGNKYYLRYRIVLDKNKDSDWSGIYSVDGKNVFLVTGAISAVTTSGSKIVNVVWQNTNLSPSYDVFVKWDSGSYSYLDTTVSASYSIIAVSGATTVGVLVQVASAQKQISSALKVFEGSATI
jgi:hypothetical protein